jgi:ABC-type Na+ efflux pump permease subunit
MIGKQQGVVLSNLLIWAVIVAVLALLGMKLAPEYMEYGKIKEIVKTIKGDSKAMSSVAEARKAFDRRADIDSVTAVKSDDLDISKDGSGAVVISFAYERRIALFANVSLLLEFQGSSRE